MNIYKRFINFFNKEKKLSDLISDIKYCSSAIYDIREKHDKLCDHLKITWVVNGYLDLNESDIVSDNLLSQKIVLVQQVKHFADLFEQEPCEIYALELAQLSNSLYTMQRLEGDC